MAESRIKNLNQEIEKLKEGEKRIEVYEEGYKLCETHLKRILKEIKKWKVKFE
jgi:hypothetical protein